MKREIGPDGNVVIYGVPQSDRESSQYAPEPYSYEDPPTQGQLGPVIFIVILVLVLVGGGVMLYLSYEDSEPGMSQAELNARLADASSRTPSGRSEAITPQGTASGSVSLDVLSDREGATVLVDYDSVGTTPLRSHKLSAGVYVLSVIFRDSGRIDTVVVLDEATSRTFSFTPEAAMRPRENEMEESLPVARSQDAETPAQINDTTPSPPEPPAEDRTQQSTADTRTQQETSSRQNQAQSQALSRRSSVGQIHIATEPSGATVVIDGQYRGRTPLRISDVEPGSYNVAVQLAGYEAERTVLDVSPSQTAESIYELVRQTATLSVLVEPWGSIYIDGELQARETDVRYSTTLYVGTYEVAAEHPVLGRKSVSVTLNPDTTRDLVIDLTADN